MAWRCVKCEKNIFAPRENAFAFAMEWRYSTKYRSLSVDIRNLHQLKDKSVVTHLLCKSPQTDGFQDRMRKAIRMPKTADHPLLF